MRALFHDGAVFHDEDEVSIANGGQAVGNDEGGAVCAQRVHRLLDEDLGTGIDRRGGLIEDEQRGLGQERAGDGDELALAGGDCAAVLVDDGVVALGQRVNEAVYLGCLCRSDDLFVRRVQAAVADVFHDRALKEHGVLEHHAHLGTQGMARHAGDIVPINENLTAI